MDNKEAKNNATEQSNKLIDLKEQAAKLKKKHEVTHEQFNQLKKKTDEFLGKEPSNSLPE